MRFYSSDGVAAEMNTNMSSSLPTPSALPPMRRSALRRAESLPTSFKERKRHLNNHLRSKTGVPNAVWTKTQSTSISPSDRKRIWLSLASESRHPKHHSQTWIFPRRDDYNRYLIPRACSTESTLATRDEKLANDNVNLELMNTLDEDDGLILLGLAFIEEPTE